MKSARDLGIYIDSDLLMRPPPMLSAQFYGALPCYVNSGRFVARWSLPTDTFQSSANTSGFRQQRVGRSSGLLGQPSSVGAACGARLTYHFRRSHHTTDALVCLHCLRNTSVHSIASLTCLAVELFVLLALAVWSAVANRAFPVVGPRI